MITVGDLNFIPYISKAKIQERIQELAAQIGQDYKDKDPLFLGILNGAFIFLGDLAKEVTIPVNFSFVKYSSYHATQSTGKVKELIGLGEGLEGRNIIVVEDIVDTGLTMKYLVEELEAQKPASISIATLLLKKEALQYDKLPLDYVGFEIKNEFVLGYGMDYNEYGRNLPEIYVKTDSAE